MGETNSALCAEALALRAALDFSLMLGLRSIVVEGDPDQLVRNLSREVVCPAGVDVIVEDIRRAVPNFLCCEFRFVRRTAISVAHVLVGSGLRGPGVRTWEARSLLYGY